MSAAVMMPVGAQAEATVYGRINNVLEFNDSGKAGEDTTADVSTVGSRFGIKGSADIGNGLTARGHYEFGLNTDKKETGLNNRIASVGVAGGFGSIDVGNQWSAFYNTTGVDMDPSWNQGGIGGTPFRASNTVKYGNSVGPLNLELDLRLNDGGDETGTEGLAGEGGGLGVRVAVTDNITLGFAYDNEDRSDMITPAVYGHRYDLSDLTDDQIKVLDLRRSKGTNETSDSTENNGSYTGLTYAGPSAKDGIASKLSDYDGVYCLSSAMVTEKKGKITANDAVATKDVGKLGLKEGDACTVTKDKTGAETERMGVSAKISLGQFYGIFAYSTKNVTDNGKETETEYAQVWGGVHLADSTSALIGFGQSETEGMDANPTALTLGLYHNMGGGLQLWYEGQSNDPDMAGMDNSVNHKAGIRFDF